MNVDVISRQALYDSKPMHAYRLTELVFMDPQDTKSAVLNHIIFIQSADDVSSTQLSVCCHLAFTAYRIF